MQINKVHVCLSGRLFGGCTQTVTHTHSHPDWLACLNWHFWSLSLARLTVAHTHTHSHKHSTIGTVPFPQNFPPARTHTHTHEHGKNYCVWLSRQNSRHHTAVKPGPVCQPRGEDQPSPLSPPPKKRTHKCKHTVKIVFPSFPVTVAVGSSFEGSKRIETKYMREKKALTSLSF